MEDKYIYNVTEKSVHVKAFGNHFDFAAGQVKRMSKEIGEFLAENKGYLGLVEVPEALGDYNRVEHDGKIMLYRETPQGASELAVHFRAGVDKRIAFLGAQVHNLKVSVAEDLAGKEMKIDPFLLATKGDEAAMEELLSYQKQAEDDNKLRLEKLKKMDRDIQRHSTAAVNSLPTKG